MTEFFTYNTLTGRRVQHLPVLDGGWTDTLNDAGDLWCKVSLRSSLVQRMRLQQSGIPGATSLAAVDGDNVWQAGPIWLHDLADDQRYLTINAGGGWTYTDHRTLLPALAGRLPTDKTTDTRFMPQDLDPDSEYPWPTDTRTSRQGMVVQILAQMLAVPHGNVPFVLPSVIAGDAQDSYRGVDTAPVGERIRQITQLLNGPDVHFQPRWNTAHDGFEHVVRIGTPTEPLLFSAQEPAFTLGNAQSSVTKLRVKVNGAKLGSQAFSSGGKSTETVIAAVATDSTLTEAGFPLFDLVDQQRSTVSEVATLQEYADELLMRGQKPISTWTFTHDTRQRPFPSAFSVGDFMRVRVLEHPYLEAGEYRMRLLSRSGDARGIRSPLVFQPSGEFVPLGGA